MKPVGGRVKNAEPMISRLKNKGPEMQYWEIWNENWRNEKCRTWNIMRIDHTRTPLPDFTLPFITFFAVTLQQFKLPKAT